MNVKDRFNITQWHKHKINFWGVPKCGNTSVKASLIKDSTSDTLEVDEISAWAHSEKYCEYITNKEAISNGYMNISVVRHPVDRSVSMYSDVRRRGVNFFGIPRDVVDWYSFLSYLTRIPDHKRNVHFRSQTYFLSVNDKLFDGKIYDLKNIESLFCDLGIGPLHANKTERFGTGLDIDLVYRIYKQDFDKFGFVK
jgi:hypothetical protein